MVQDVLHREIVRIRSPHQRKRRTRSPQRSWPAPPAAPSRPAGSAAASPTCTRQLLPPQRDPAKYQRIGAQNQRQQQRKAAELRHGVGHGIEPHLPFSQSHHRRPQRSEGGDFSTSSGAQSKARATAYTTFASRCSGSSGFIRNVTWRPSYSSSASSSPLITSTGICGVVSRQ